MDFIRLESAQADRERQSYPPQNRPRSDGHPGEISHEPPPNGGYGWVCTFCVFMINAHTWGVNSAWGVILAHFLAHSTFSHASRIQYALIGGLSISQALLIGPLVTKTQGLVGTSITLLLGTVLIFAGLLAASYADKIWHLFLSQGVCFGFGMGFLYIPALSVLPAWFSTRRSFAMGLAASGAGLGGLAYNFVSGYTIETYGVRVTYRILAFCTLAANLMSSLFLRTRMETGSNTVPSLRLADLGRVEVFLVTFWGVTTELGYIALLYSLPTYASSIGLNAHQGSVTGAILNLGLAIGRPLVGWTSDKFGRITVPTILTAFCGLVCLAIWIPAQTYPVLLVFALFAGMVCGIFWGTVTPVTAEVIGLGRLSSVFTLTCLIMVAPSAISEVVALSLVRRSGYLSTQIYVACMFLLGSVGLWLLRSWKLYDVEKKAADERDGLGRGDVSMYPGFLQWIRLGKLFIRGRV